MANKQENITAGTGLSFSGTTLNADYGAASNGGLALSGTDFSLDLSNLTADQVIPKKLTIETNGPPQLIIKPEFNYSNDGAITIRGARNGSTTSDHAQLRFENYDIDSGGTTHELFRITGRVTNASSNIGGFVLYNFTDGTTSSGALTMNNNGNFNMGNGNTFQDDYKLSINGVLNTDNISTNSSTIIIGNTGQSGAATTTNSFSYLNLTTDKAHIGGPTITLNHSSSSSSYGVTGMLINSTATTIYNDLQVEGDTNIDDTLKVGKLEVTDSGARATNGALTTSAIIKKGILLLDSDTGNGCTKGSGVIQINCADVGKLKEGICMRAIDDNNNCINFRNTSDSARGRIDGNGSSAVLYRTSSDVRLKENIENMESCWELLKRTNPKKFTWITDQTNDVGFIAQDIYADPGFYPLKPIGNKYNGCDNSLNTFESDGYCEFPMESDGVIYPHALDYGRFTPYLWKALQEAIIKIETLETKVAELEEKITAS
tara:strand:- start:7304 stop:8770 length:1467 start_codon:yes stop_codon:yes gene_type:complete